ncbi:hypothetical protein ACFLRQ_03355, partial [Bacteroidota bacterium]
MKKYIVLYHAPIDAWTQTGEASKEEMEEGMKQWMVWAEKCGDKLLDMGSPLTNGLTLSPGGKTADRQKMLAGYSIMQGENRDEVYALLKDHPHLAWNEKCEIDIQ